MFPFQRWNLIERSGLRDERGGGGGPPSVWKFTEKIPRIAVCALGIFTILLTHNLHARERGGDLCRVARDADMCAPLPHSFFVICRNERSSNARFVASCVVRFFLHFFPSLSCKQIIPFLSKGEIKRGWSRSINTLTSSR